jgi:hypothetical protein
VITEHITVPKNDSELQSVCITNEIYPSAFGFPWKRSIVKRAAQCNKSGSIVMTSGKAKIVQNELGSATEMHFFYRSLFL